MIFMERCIICLGSNQNGKEHLLQATKNIDLIFSDIKWGEIIQTAPEGTSHPSPYFNRAGIFSTNMDIQQVKSIFKSIERQHGRTPSSKASGRIPLDIDLLVYGSQVLKPDDMNRTYVRQALSTICHTL